MPQARMADAITFLYLYHSAPSLCVGLFSLFLYYIWYIVLRPVQLEVYLFLNPFPQNLGYSTDFSHGFLRTNEIMVLQYAVNNVAEVWIMMRHLDES